MCIGTLHTDRKEMRVIGVGKRMLSSILVPKTENKTVWGMPDKLKKKRWDDSKSM